MSDLPEDDDAPRRPLRPLAPVLRARDRGENPDLIERANRIRRHDGIRERLKARAESRLLVLGLFFVVVFGAVGGRMAQFATSVPEEPRMSIFGSTITSARADITDRKGRVLATNLHTQALYAHPQDMIDIPYAVRELSRIFPDLEHDELLARLTRPGRKFVWLRKTLSPEEVQAVHDIGDPGLLFATRDMRLYPNGHLAAHVLGGASFGDEGVRAAEVIGVAGIEKAMDARLRDPDKVDEPLQLSIDMTIQAATRKVLQGGIDLYEAKGGSAIIMDIKSGEIVSMVSLPDFDPNRRPRPALTGDPSDSPLFNRAVLGVYELGSVFKIFATANALDLGLVTPDTQIDTQSPLVYGRFKIGDFHNYGPTKSVRGVIEVSSNVGTAHIAQMIGPTRQKEFLGRLGFFEPTPVELVEAPTGRPLLPKVWGDLAGMTISFGHGMSSSPLHLAVGYASLLNGGHKVTPTLLKRDGPVPEGPRVVSEQTSRQSREMLRLVVTDGTASMGDVPGYYVAGKTGTADKPKPGGGYYKNRNMVTFASIFPYYDPKYVVITTLDEAKVFAAGEERRTAGWTVVPVAAELIRRVAPLLDMRPAIEEPAQPGIREARNNH
ncbi:peptidoglycan D,D-transpeptidase FtsI family protein [Mangrovicoccus algicola]|uniref:Penicillin-binding protein 2 n=1 Tax=Mangrovicoccus algicola TaxID=2771008 RepID=A0A8J6YYS9_9RHOB|nr:penicillin-binding protein 2 [Mangrovicoccus algicola]MBE3639124.1 penicillin-binding protein 2 [Mangrovicoccus algicola]